MNKITSLQPRKKSLQALYLDGEFFCDVDKETMFFSKYKEGDELTAEQLDELLYQSGLNRAKSRGLYLLGFKDYTKKGMVDKLKPDVGTESAQAAADYLEEKDFINDQRYAMRYARDLVKRKNLSGYRLIFELTGKGVSKELAQEAANEALCELDASEIIREILNKKYRLYKEDEKIQKRAFAALVRMGYSYDDINKVLRSD